MLYSITEYDENKEYNDDDVFYIDDRGLKFDPEKEELVRPRDTRYDELPILDYYELSKKRTGFEEIFVIDYSTLRYDEENGEYIRPCDSRYNNLPISENMEDLCSE